MTNVFHLLRFLMLIVAAGLTGGCEESPGDAADVADTESHKDSETGQPDGGLSSLEFDIVGKNDASISIFSVTVTYPGGEHVRQTCNNGDAALTSSITCNTGGFTLYDPASRMDVVVKRHGYQFSSHTVEVEPEGEDANVGVKTIALTPLDDFETTDDYVTGFGPDQGIDAFEALAYESGTELGALHIVKFYIDSLNDDPVVYFQNTKRHPLHFEFARTVLGKSMSSLEFWRETYTGEERTAMAGTLTFYSSIEGVRSENGDKVSKPVTLTFFSSDDLSPTLALRCHRLLEERMGFLSLDSDGIRLFYVPAVDAKESELEASVDDFAKWDAAWLLNRHLYENVTLQILNPGIAYGTLRHLQPDALESSAVSFHDILVMSSLPNMLPIVGGTITEVLQTPLAHVNVAAMNRGTPNIALINAGERDDVKELLGKLVRFEVTDGAYTLSPATPSEAEAFWAETEKPAFVPPYDIETGGLPGFDSLGYGDSEYVGAKAANLGELYSLLEEGVPDGFGIPFLFYHEFMTSNLLEASICQGASDACIESERGNELCSDALKMCLKLTGGTLIEAAEALIDDVDFQVDSTLREAALFTLRYAIENGTVDDEFGETLEDRIEEVFGGSRAKMRSSTNAEDLLEFSGAGMYESVSTAVDDTPSAADKLRDVWASVWSWRAFEERSFWNVDHLSVKMGCAVNRVFGNEAANGVLITRSISNPSVSGMYVNVQLGETSVTNPIAGVTPETFTIVSNGAGGPIQVVRDRFSSLTADEPIMKEEEIRVLYERATTIQDHFSSLYDLNPERAAFELEFKLYGSERAVIIKQVRPFTGN